MGNATRFWSKVAKGGPNDCWEWTASTNSNGYGRFYLDGDRRAHRVAWMLAHGGDIPRGMVVCHSCDNPPCVNPSHLFLGTQRDNVHDCIRKGRRVLNSNPFGPGIPQAGEANGSAKLTLAEVERIRTLRESGTRAVVLAEMFGVHRSQVYNIVSGKRWA